MSRAERLIDLIQILRRHRRPVTGEVLARELDVSVRTIYRDIEALCLQGARIEGERGLGFVLRPGFLLPPLMFSEDEVEALALGSRWVAGRADAPLKQAALNALAKIGAVLPDELRQELEASGLIVGPGKAVSGGDADLAAIRQAIRKERKLRIAYADAEGRATRRTIWPFALGFFDEVRMVAAWCELRQSFRHFRADRISQLTLTDRRYPRRRLALLKEWRERENIPAA